MNIHGYLGAALDLVKHDLHARTQVGLTTRATLLARGFLVPQFAPLIALGQRLFACSLRNLLLGLLLLRRGVKVR